MAKDVVYASIAAPMAMDDLNMATALQLEQLAEFEEAERYADEARRLAKPPRAVHIDQLRGAQHPAPFGLLFENRDGLIYIRPEATR